MFRYLLRVAIAIDQLLNALLGGNPDETISSRVGRGVQKGSRVARVLAPIIDALFYLLTRRWGHCRESIETLHTKNFCPNVRPTRRLRGYHSTPSTHGGKAGRLSI